MAQFDESKVINALHADMAEIGKKYWYSASLIMLKRYVEDTNTNYIGELKSVHNALTSKFHIDETNAEFIYPYEEPPKKRMTNRQLSEWVTKGNGEFTPNALAGIYTEYSYRKCVEDYEVDKDIKIRFWDSEEWIEPTVDIYERDCKGVTK